MIGGDGREGGPQMLYPGARGASLPVDGRDPCMAAPFPRAPEPPTSRGVVFTVPGLQDPTAADLGLAQQCTAK